MDSVSLHRLGVEATDVHASASFLASVLGVPAQLSEPSARTSVHMANGVTLEYRSATTVAPQRYTFVLTEDDFDAAYGRILDTRARTWADPDRTRPAELDHRGGGRGICVEDPDGHLIQILTRVDGRDRAVRPR